MRLFVGLGNPGKAYAKTRHNCGYMVVDLLASKLGLSFTKRQFDGLYTRLDDIIILKPETYMNLSGRCVTAFLSYYKIDIDDLIVVYDDMDIPVGKIRIREKGSSAGQKGIQNIIDLCGTEKIKRIRIGIGENEKMDNKDYVLSAVPKEEKEVFLASIDRASEALDYYRSHSFSEVMNKFNVWRKLFKKFKR